ncbi:hypothetical protein AAVH_02636 [Aphelenchoides avenae]|nr:hypothetical protein AAVH_02636 [Aphelenchus avenae]
MVVVFQANLGNAMPTSVARSDVLNQLEKPLRHARGHIPLRSVRDSPAKTEPAKAPAVTRTYDRNCFFSPMNCDMVAEPSSSSISVHRIRPHAATSNKTLLTKLTQLNLI